MPTAACGSCAAVMPLLRPSTGAAVPRVPLRGLTPEVVSGRATVVAHTVNVHGWIPGSEPYLIGLVAIDEQESVRLTTNLVDVEPEDVRDRHGRSRWSSRSKTTSSSRCSGRSTKPTVEARS